MKYMAIYYPYNKIILFGIIILDIGYIMALDFMDDKRLDVFAQETGIIFVLINRFSHDYRSKRKATNILGKICILTRRQGYSSGNQSVILFKSCGPRECPK
jgi:hypothetical protein